MLAWIEAADYSAPMKTVTLTAHVNGENIQLDEPFVLPANARLLVTILPESLTDPERQEWYALSHGAAVAPARVGKEQERMAVNPPVILELTPQGGRQWQDTILMSLAGTDEEFVLGQQRWI